MITHRRDPSSVWQVDVDGAFPPRLVPDYEAFLALPGRVLKLEPHTLIRQLDSLEASPGGEDAGYVLKQYHFTRWSRLRTWQHISKAQREYNTLVFCREQGIPAVVPVGYGTRRSRLGAVTSCFLITAYAPGFVSLRDWLQAHPLRDEAQEAALTCLMEALGRHVRLAHAQRFFFLSLLAKNMLVRPAADGRLDWLLLDQCYSRHVHAPLLSRAVQVRDLGALLGSIQKYSGTDYEQAFMTGYLPDPLGGTEVALRRGLRRGIRTYCKQSPLTRLLRRIRWRRQRLQVDFRQKP